MFVRSAMRGLVASIVIMFFAALGPMVGPVSAAESTSAADLVSATDPTWPAPYPGCSFPEAPQVMDRSGSDQDEFIVPDLPCVYYGDSGGNGMLPGPQSSGGATSVLVTTLYLNEQAEYINGPQFTPSFNQAVTASEAPDSFSLSLGACNTFDNQVAVTMTVTNPVDGSLRYHDIALKAERSDGWTPAVAYDLGERILDGETRGVIVGNDTINHRSGVLPGRYTVKVWRIESNGVFTTLPTLQLSVPACGIVGADDGDLPSSGGSTQLASPKGSLVQKAGRRMLAIANNKKVGHWSAFKVIIDPPRGRTLTKSFTVRAHRVSYHLFKKRPKGTKYVMKAKSLVRTSTGAYRQGSWKVVVRRTVR